MPIIGICLFYFVGEEVIVIFAIQTMRKWTRCGLTKEIPVRYITGALLQIQPTKNRLLWSRKHKYLLYVPRPLSSLRLESNPTYSLVYLFISLSVCISYVMDWNLRTRCETFSFGLNIRRWKHVLRLLLPAVWKSSNSNNMVKKIIKPG